MYTQGISLLRTTGQGCHLQKRAKLSSTLSWAQSRKSWLWAGVTSTHDTLTVSQLEVLLILPLPHIVILTVTSSRPHFQIFQLNLRSLAPALMLSWAILREYQVIKLQIHKTPSSPLIPVSFLITNDQHSFRISPQATGSTHGFLDWTTGLDWIFLC